MSPEPRRSEPGAVTDGPDSSDPPIRLLFGVTVHDVTEEAAIRWMLERARSGRGGHIVTSNLDFARLASVDSEMQRIHFEGDLVIPDGMPLVWFSRLFGPRIRERVAGSDLVSRFAEAGRDAAVSFFAIGSAPGVAEKALRLLESRNPGIQVAGWESPPVAPLLAMEDLATTLRIGSLRPNLVYVAFGAPKQEKWIRLHRGRLGPAVAMGVGGSLDFIAGTQSRAPRWIQKIGLEWFWRMASQPRRLFKRYFQDILFLGSMLGRWGILRLSPGGASRRPPAPDPELLARRGAVLHSLGREGRVPAPEASSVVLDLSGRVWLDSDLLGAMVDLGRRCRARGGRLFLTGRAPRVDRLLRWCRLERYLELPDSAEELLQRLDRLADPAQAARIVTSGERLQIVLPDEWDGGAADRLRPLFEAQWKSGSLREVVVEGSRLEYLDTAGARFLRDARQEVVRTPGKSFWLRGFAERHLERLRRDGFDAINVDRRGRFRLDSDLPLEPHPSAGARSG